MQPRTTSRRLQAILAGRLEDIAGTHAAGSIPVREHVINAALITAPSGAIREIEIRIGDNNRLEAGVRVAFGPFSKWFRPELVLDTQGLWGDSPGLLFTFAGSHYGAMARLVDLFAHGALPAGVHIGRKQLAVDFGAMPQAAPYRHLFGHIKRLQITTQAGTVWIDFELRVSE